jgi:hypothetical protein
MKPGSTAQLFPSLHQRNDTVHVGLIVCALDLIRQTGPAVEMRHESPQPLQARSSPQIGSQGAS